MHARTELKAKYDGISGILPHACNDLNQKMQSGYSHPEGCPRCDQIKIAIYGQILKN